MTPQPTRLPTIEEFEAGYVPNDGDVHEVIATPIEELALAGFKAWVATWPDDDNFAPEVSDIFLTGVVWMKKFMEAAVHTAAMHPEDFAAKGAE
jgi:hypothetical protein